MKFYHITTAIGLSSILLEGIIPYKGIGFCTPNNKSSKQKNYPNVVYLTNDVKHIFKTQLTNEWCVRHHPYILELDLDDCNINRFMTPWGTVSDIEFIHKGKIDKEFIKNITKYDISLSYCEF